MPTVLVKSGSAEYEVLVGTGLLSSLRRRVGGVCPGAGRRVFVLTSPGIWGLWSERFLASFLSAAPAKSHRDSGGAELPTVLFLPAGERYKRLGEVERLAEEMAASGADRSSVLIALGGGIVGDVGGFLAAVYMRGIEYVQVPTTLLAQVDSSVGGKTGVNLGAGKNLVGGFHAPRAVFADIDLLGTLPERELRAGLFESVKAGIIRDRSLFTYMERNVGAILAREPKALARVIADSVRMKAEVVGIDERESGLRMILNFGHTLGHAVEAATKYRGLLHGEAVAWGMLAATHLGLRRGTVTEAESDRIVDLIFEYGPLPAFRVPGGSSLAAATVCLMEAAGRDKKNRAGVRRFVLPAGIGDAVVVDDVTDSELYSATEWLVGAAGGAGVKRGVGSRVRIGAAGEGPGSRS